MTECDLRSLFVVQLFIYKECLVYMMHIYCMVANVYDYVLANKIALLYPQI